ncbi:MAG: DNA polymerase III subunit beta [Chloroflexota bacterium]|nr:DNA polymerase III subunit beta [Chloroflexota bacterium]
MKLTCLQENLSRGLGIVGRAVAARSTLPITGNVLLATEKSRLKLAATNLEIAIVCWVGAKVEEEGAITVPARLFADFVNTLPADTIGMSTAPQSRTMELACLRVQGRISGTDAAEFPPIPQIGEGVSTQLDPDVLRLAITQVAFAAATEDTRPVLTGCLCEFEGDTLTLAAADGFRLAVHKAPLSQPVAEKTSVIVPARALHELHRLIAERDEPVDVTINPTRSQVLFRLKDVEMVSQLIQGTFPNYAQLIPQSHATRADMSLADFTKATRTSAIFAREGSAIVRVQVTPGKELSQGKVVLSARAEEVGDNVGEVDAAVEGEETKIAFNTRYLSDVLGVMRGEKVRLDTTSPSSPGVFSQVGIENYLHVIMPMFVQW